MMSGKSTIGRVAIYVCLAALLLTALMPGAAGLALAFLVFTAWLFAEIALVVLLPYADEDSHAQKTLALAVFSPRPPPAR
jgi:hypothetical protein